MILLLHLTSCSALANEEHLQSKTSLAQTFDLVGNRLQQGRFVSAHVDSALTAGKSEKASLIYCLLAKLRFRVWKRAGWQRSLSPDGQACPLDDLREAIEHAHPQVHLEDQDKTQTKVPEKAAIRDIDAEMSIEAYDQLDFQQYDDIFEQFLQTEIII